MTLSLIDTHAHLTFPQYQEETIETLIARAKASSVTKIINVGADFESSKGSVELAQKYPEIYATIGLHPHEEKKMDNDSLSDFKKLLESDKVVAVGEIGLDYFKYEGNRTDQQALFEQQLQIAQENDLPVIIHNRDAQEDTLSILNNFSPLKGVVHCFAGDQNFAKQVLDMDFLISFTGIITFPNAKELREVAAYVPLEKIMLETDCPFLAPQTHRGQTNEPAYVKDIAEKLAEIKELPFEEIAKATTKNAENFFNLSC
jgi:TatD DNase family protein